MDFVHNINEAIKVAMKEKDQARLRALRAIKAALLLAQTEKDAAAIDQAKGVQILQKLAKQRRDSMTIYKEQGRDDLYQTEREELEVIETYLPKQMGQDALDAAIQAIIQSVGAAGMGDLSKVMPLAMKQLAGQSDNKSIADTIRRLLS